MEKESQRYREAKPVAINRYLIGKRLFDIIVSAVLIICCIPIFIALSIAIAVSSGRPVLYFQDRIGKDRDYFTILKFRSMKTMTKHRYSYDWKDGVPDDFVFKTGFSNAVTPVGKFLRKFSLDELPQLYNVLIGEMSIVGPRPEIPEIAEHYNRHQVKRLSVKPGITGLAQVSGRSEINHGMKIKYDLHYIENQSFLLDMKILWKTITSVIRGKGAY